MESAATTPTTFCPA